MSLILERAKGPQTWVFGLAWVDGTLYIGCFIYLAIKFKKVEA